MSNDLISKSEFAALFENANKSDESKDKLWFTLADRIIRFREDISSSSLKALTSGQSALICCAGFRRGAQYDFLTSITQSELPGLTLKALETLQAAEYLDLLRKTEAVFKGKKFPEYPEDMVAALQKQPDGYFDRIAEQFVTGKGMKRPLREYVYDYVTAHPQDFCASS